MEGMARVVELRTPWPLADCRQRLASNVSPMQDSRTHVEIRRDRAILRAGGDPTVIRGSVTERSFSLLRTGTMRNSFTSEARGILVDGGDHTRIELRYRLPVATVVFSAVWLGTALLFVVIALVMVIHAGLGALPILGFTLVFPAFFVVLVAVGRRKARVDEAFLTAFVCRVLAAHPVAALPAHPPYRG